MYGDQSGELVCGSWGLKVKGYIHNQHQGKVAAVSF